MKSGPNPPMLLVEGLSLPTGCPGSVVFVTSTNHYPPYTRIALTIIELFIFLFPLLYLLAVLYSLFSLQSTRLLGKSAWHTISSPPYPLHGPAVARIFDRICHGIQAALELLRFRLWHGFPMEEPTIVSFRANSQHHVDTPTRMASMYKEALWPLYWLPLRRDAIVTPVPCYSAMRVLMSGWKKGRLPRNAWGDGRWELLDVKMGIWKRVNLKERPTWSEYTKASEAIKARFFLFFLLSFP